MNKEENRLIIEQLNKFGRVPETYELLRMIEDLEQENQKYKEVIDKAIEYILKETKSMPVNGCTIRLKELLDILKEVKTC